MIQKFLSIQNVGRFNFTGTHGDLNLRRLNLIYAENGRGKTTLCGILRSLQTGRPEYIAERGTIGATGPTAVRIRMADKTVNFVNMAWSETEAEMAIFDSVFVHSNVYAGDNVDHDHRRNLYRIVIGAQGVDLSQRVEALDREIREINGVIRERTAGISPHLPAGVSLENYLRWEPISNIDDEIEVVHQEIVERQRLRGSQEQILTMEPMAPLRCPSFPENFQAVLSKRVDDVLDEAEENFEQHLSRHQMGTRGEPWISEGLEFVVEERCPFCGQDIRPSEIIEVFRTHFNQSYQSLKIDVRALQQQVRDAFSDSVLSSLRQTLSKNSQAETFWIEFLAEGLPVAPTPDPDEQLRRVREYALHLIRAKEEHPVDSIAVDDEMKELLTTSYRLAAWVEQYNKAVVHYNTRIGDLKTDIQSKTDSTSLEARLKELTDRQYRFTGEVASACDDLLGDLEAKRNLDTQKRSAKEELDAYCDNIFPKYEQQINRYLELFGTGFRIVNADRSYRGGSPSTQFDIEINNTAVALGDARTPTGVPTFKTTLSSGDRNALALAFFMASLDDDPHIDRKIVVFDDPFTSLDRFRRACTQQLIGRLARRVRQVIVLSHDADFLKVLFDNFPSAEVKTLQLSWSGENTRLGEWDIESETQSMYMKDFNILLEFYRERRGRPIEVARALRPFLEGLLRGQYPNTFNPNEWLGDFIVKIRAAESASTLTGAQHNLAEIEAINDYSKRYHHAQNANADNEPMSSDELYGFVKRALKLVGVGGDHPTELAPVSTV